MKQSVILTDRFGPDILLVLRVKGQVLHRERANLKVPGCSLVLNALLTKQVFLVLGLYCPFTLNPPESFSCKQTMGEVILIAKITNLFNDDENEIRRNMSFFVKVYRHFTSVLLCGFEI